MDERKRSCARVCARGQHNNNRRRCWCVDCHPAHNRPFVRHIMCGSVKLCNDQMDGTRETVIPDNKWTISSNKWTETRVQYITFDKLHAIINLLFTYIIVDFKPSMNVTFSSYLFNQTNFCVQKTTVKHSNN